MEEKRLILNADDYGMCHSANQAVEDLFGKNGITSTTLMTPCPWAIDGVRRAVENPKMKVGLHLTLTAEWSQYKWSAVNKTSFHSLHDPNGFLYSTSEDFEKNAVAEDVIAELEAQMEFLVSRHLKPTHVDSHMGSVYGFYGQSFLKQTLEFCGKYKMAFRLPKNIDSYGPVPNELREIYNHAIAYAKALGVGLPDNLLRFPRERIVSDTYETIKRDYISVIQQLPPGLSELFMHPAKESDELKTIITQDWEMRVWEYMILQDEEFIDAIAKNGIRLVGWNEVV